MTPGLQWSMCFLPHRATYIQKRSPGTKSMQAISLIHVNKMSASPWLPPLALRNLQRWFKWPKPWLCNRGTGLRLPRPCMDWTVVP
ncbi:hypothetical protein QQP08_002621 [Theobroma cacao]|nr:hypothetical protein QQP08_002621 [Theobroma cacao]